MRVLHRVLTCRRRCEHVAQERLWLTEPARATCLAEVVEVRGPRFRVDRALFAPRSRSCRHPQPADKGRAWMDGDKRRLAGVEQRGDDVWYRLRGTTPKVGDKLQCELDQRTRSLVARAHTAMHLFIAALADAGAPAMVADPEVRGGGHFRITLAWAVPPPQLADILRATQQALASNQRVEQAFAVKAEAGRFLTPQAFEPADPVPGPEVMPVVRIGDVAYPCDGAHVAWTRDVGRLVIQHARAGKEGFVVVGKTT